MAKREVVPRGKGVGYFCVCILKKTGAGVGIAVTDILQMFFSTGRKRTVSNVPDSLVSH